MNTLVVVHKDVNRTDEWRARFAQNGEFRLVGYTADGIAGMELIEQVNPAYVVLDMLLPGMDGLAILEQMREKGLRAKIIAMSSFLRDELVRQAEELGAQYFLVNPCPFELLMTRLRQLRQLEELPQANREACLEEKISRIIISAGITPKVKGYFYLREGIRIAALHPDVMESVTGKLYPQISERFSSTTTRVERGIRNALDIAWSNGSLHAINRIFGVQGIGRRSRPTNREFIALLADKTLLDHIQ